MDEILMRWGEARYCPDCAAETVFVPVPAPDEEVGDRHAWCCATCDAAVERGDLRAA